MIQKLLLLYNPYSGKAQITACLPRLVDIFSRANYLVTAVPLTTNKNWSFNLLKDYAMDYDLIVCCGGDGTFHTILNHLLASHKAPPPFGYIPSGSTNDFASSTGIPKNPEQAASMISAGFYTPIDIGDFNGTYFSYVAAFGAFSDISYATDQNLKNNFGYLAYVMNGLKTISGIRRYPLKIKSPDIQLQGDYVFGMVANAKSVAGYPFFEQDADLHDGLFECLFIEYPETADALAEILNCIRNKRFNHSRYIHYFQSESIDIFSTEDIAWTLDGEYGGDTKIASIICKKALFNIILPS